MTSTRTRPRARLRPRLRGRVLALLVPAAAALLGAWLWVRDSPLVAVERVQVVGVSGPDAPAIRSALVSAARTMTTLDVNDSQLRTAVAPYPVVKRLVVRTAFPHGMRIRVIEQVPVAVVEAAGRRFTVSGDGTLLRDETAAQALPVIRLTVPPGGAHLTGQALLEARLAGAAPYPLLAKVQSLRDDPTHGLVAQLGAGPAIYFGAPAQLAAKWTAAAEVLADPGSAGASYIDVTDPARPAAGTGSDTTAPATSGSAGGVASASGSAASASSASGSTTAAGSTAPASTSPGSTASSGSTSPGSSAPGSTAPASTSPGSTAPGSTSAGG